MVQDHVERSQGVDKVREGSVSVVPSLRFVELDFSPPLFAEPLKSSSFRVRFVVEFDPGCEGLIYTPEGLPIHGASLGDGTERRWRREQGKHRADLSFLLMVGGTTAIVGGTDNLRRVEYVLSQKARGGPHHIYIETCEFIPFASSFLCFFSIARSNVHSDSFSTSFEPTSLQRNVRSPPRRSRDRTS